MSGPSVPTVGCVILTQGRRPDQLDLALRSVQAQEGVVTDVVVVWNGGDARVLTDGARSVRLPHNAGIPAGRNAGAAMVSGELVLFLDDDALLTTTSFLAAAGARFAVEPDLGALQPRVTDPRGGRPSRRWVPRLVVGDRFRSSDVCALWEGCVVLRRSVFDRVGGWPDVFWYMHEGIDLAWRVWDAGYRVWYDGSIEAAHPVVPSARHPRGDRLDARNRVWLARRNLPLVLAPLYVLTWAVLTVLRGPGLARLREAAAGFRDGWRVPCGPRRPMSWRTVWRMTRAGRPPIV